MSRIDHPDLANPHRPGTDSYHRAEVDLQGQSDLRDAWQRQTDRITAETQAGWRDAIQGSRPGPSGARSSQSGAVSGLIVVLAVGASAYLFTATPDHAATGKQLAILWAVVLTAVWFLNNTAIGRGLSRILGIAFVAAMVLAGAYFIRLWFGEVGLTWAAIIVGGLFLLGMGLKVIAWFFSTSVGAMTMLGGLIVGGLYLYGNYTG